LNTLLLHSAIQQFINASLDKEVTQIALQKNPFPQVAWLEILNQIGAKQKAKHKLPTWFARANLLYPSKLSIEQTSSEKTASYKAQLVAGESIIDLTGGFGVDDFYFCKHFKEVIHCELNSELSGIVAHNGIQFNLYNLSCIQGDSTIILKDLNRYFDWIYIDPSRRNDSKGKVFMLKDCLPKVPELVDFYFEFTSNILIKTAPILDLTAGQAELKNVKEIHIVAIDNEVKELLWILEKDLHGPINLHTFHQKKESSEIFSFIQHALKEAVDYAQPEQYLYEPNAAIMKSGGFDEVAVRFKLGKLHPHSHLYTSGVLQEFPGRVFKIDSLLAYNKKEMKSILEGKKANVTARNFPETVESLRKKWNIKEGGDLYCFFTTSSTNEKIVLLCTKID